MTTTPRLEAPADGLLVGGVRIARFVSADVLPTQLDYARRFLERRTELASNLLNAADERVTYDLRIVSSPPPAVHGDATVTVVLLCALRGLDHTAAERHLAAFGALLDASFPEYDLEPLAASDVAALLHPFQPAHVVTIGRRTAWERLDALRRPTYQRQLGFDPVAGHCQAEPAPSAARAYHIYPLRPAARSLARLCGVLVRHPQPVAVSFRLRPTTLQEAEAAVLERQVAACERFSQLQVGPAGPDPEALAPALREQARALQALALEMLHGLRDDAALTTVEIASPAPIPPLLADVVGSLLTGPAGDPRDGLLRGGYDVVDRGGDPTAAAAFVTADLIVRPPPGAPPDGERLAQLAHAGQAAATLPLPPAGATAPPGTASRRWLAPPPPAAGGVEPEDGILLARGPRGERGVVLETDDRLRHVWVIGQTGSGKTTLLERMILEDLRAGAGVAVLDPHGDLYRGLLGKIPSQRLDDVVLLDPTDASRAAGLNLLGVCDPDARHRVADEVVDMIIRLTMDEYGGNAASFVGPVFVQHATMNLLLVMSNPRRPGTLLDLARVFSEKDAWRDWAPFAGWDPLVSAWVDTVLPHTDYTTPGSEQVSLGGYVASKLRSFAFQPALRRIFGQRRSTVDLGRIMDQGRILLVNLAKGELTEQPSRFLGMVVLAALQAALMGRSRSAPEARRPFHVYVDEFQSVATRGFATLLSEGRKYGVGLVLANQFVTQLDRRIADAVLGNAGTLVAFRLGPEDAETLAARMLPGIPPPCLTSLPNRRAYIRPLVDGETCDPFVVRTVLDPAPGDDATARRVSALARRRWTRPASVVDREVADTRVPWSKRAGS